MSVAKKFVSDGPIDLTDLQKRVATLSKCETELWPNASVASDQMARST